VRGSARDCWRASPLGQPGLRQEHLRAGRLTRRHQARAFVVDRKCLAFVKKRFHAARPLQGGALSFDDSQDAPRPRGGRLAGTRRHGQPAGRPPGQPRRKTGRPPRENRLADRLAGRPAARPDHSVECAGCSKLGSGGLFLPISFEDGRKDALFRPPRGPPQPPPPRQRPRPLKSTTYRAPVPR